MKLVDAVYARIMELIKERDITLYALFKASGVPYSTMATIPLSKTVTLSTIYGVCEGLEITLENFFNSPLFARENITD